MTSIKEQGKLAERNCQHTCLKALMAAHREHRHGTINIQVSLRLQKTSWGSSNRRQPYRHSRLANGQQQRRPSPPHLAFA